MESQSQPTQAAPERESPPQSQQKPVANDALDLRPAANPSSPAELRDSMQPSRASNTLEYQMQMNIDPRQPRGEPQLVGLTRLRYDPSKLRVEKEFNEPTSNYILETLNYFYPDKPNSKRVTQMREHSIKMSRAASLIRVSIQLPHRMLLEQVNLCLNHSSKKQSDFSKQFQLICAVGSTEEITLKSAYSECVTRNCRIEYNLVGATHSLELVFAKDCQASSNVSVEQVSVKFQPGAHDRLINEDDDQRILSSLPGQPSSEAVAVSQSDPNFANLLKSIEVVGFNMNTVPAITNLTYFMNQQFYLQNRGKGKESNELEMMTCQLLITTKRATQAVEMFRKMQIRCLSQKITSTRQKHAQIVNCAVYELLVADALSPNMQLSEKTMSIVRLCTFLRGEEPSDIRMRFPSQFTVKRIDAYSSMLVALPECLRFTLACLGHRYEIVRISALKMIKYILETLGCSLDYGMIFILKAMLNYYPSESLSVSAQYDECGFNLKPILDTETSILEYLFRHKPSQKGKVTEPTPTLNSEEPHSGSKRAMMNIYSNVLDTFISVLSSVSSHILHSIFYEVVEPAIIITSGSPTEVRVFSCKIADKIFTICQGDLILTPRLLDSLLTLTSAQKQPPTDQIESTAQTQVKNLLQSIRQKVLPNYSNKGFQSLVQWFVQQLTDIKRVDDCEERVRQIAELITIVAIGRSKNEEEANQLIKLSSFDKYGGGPSSELYLVLAPLVYWLEYAVDREERFPLFLQIYQTIKDVISGLPKSQASLDMLSVLMPSLQRASDFMASNSPSLSMLKFLDLILNDIMRVFQKNQRVQVSNDLQFFFAEMLQNFVPYLSYSMYEESIYIFEILLQLCADVITEKVICACIIGLVDKYTMKSKQLKSTAQNFIKFMLQSVARFQLKNQSSPTSQRTEGQEEVLSEESMMRTNYFEMMADFCFFSNSLCGGQQRQSHWDIVAKQLEFRSKQDIHDLNVEKLQFFIDSLTQMNEQHITVFTNLITYPSFRSCLMSLIDNGESQIRLKALEVMEQLTQYYVQHCPSKTVYEFTNGANKNEQMDAEFISHERLYISQIVIQVARASLEKSNDCYLQFNSLILLDYLFQNLLPVPTFQNEQMKSKKQRTLSAGHDSEENPLDEITMDVEILSVSDSTPELDVMDPAYLRMRMKLVFSLWPYIQQALNSPWSNIRSICYGLICSMLKVDVNDYPKDEPEKLIQQHLSYDESEHVYATQTGLASIVLPMLNSLLASKESESKAGGLNILGSFCGLSYDFSEIKINKFLAFFQRNSKFVSYQIWQLVYNLQDDWDITIREASVVLVQLCAPRNCILYYQSLQEKREKTKLDYMATMRNVSDAYTKHAQFKHFDVSQYGVSTQYAARAVQFFPKEKDCKVILDAISHDTSAENHIGLTLNEFMYSRQQSIPQEVLSSSQIMQMSDELEVLITKFNPNFEDKRLTKGVQPMSRRRQMEIELGMVSKNKESEGNFESDPCFFVDQYSDEQIGEIISIFRNDFKPPKNLWIEKQPNQYGTQNYGHHGQPPQSQSPDFYQDIYSDAIEQLNQHQMMMQQKQQDELQQQVSSGQSSASQSSLSSQDSVLGNDEPKPLVESPTRQVDSQNSSTPSPDHVVATSDEPKKRLSPKANPKQIQTNPVVPNQIPGQWPTSPVLVSSAASDKSKQQQQTTSFTKKPAPVEKKPESPKKEKVPVKADKQETVRVAADEPSQPKKDDDAKKRETFAGNQTQNLNHSSAPEFTHLAAIKNHSPKQYNSFGNETHGAHYSSSGGGAAANANSGDQRISRKTAQTYLSNLNNGFINNRLSQQLMAQADSKSSLLNLNQVPPKKLNQKSSQQHLEKTYGTTKPRSKKRNASSSPEEPFRNKKGSKLSKKQKEKSFGYCGPNAKQMSNLNDLNYFIKAIEKDLKNNTGGSYPVTPNSLRRRVEEQMKALGLDAKINQRNEETRRSADKLAKLKSLNLAQIVRQDDHSAASSSKMKQSPNKLMFTGHDSDSDFCKTQRLDKKTNLLPNDKLRSYREKSESIERDFAVDRQSSGRGASNTSASHSYQYPLLNQPAILTERERTLRLKEFGKHSNTTRYDQTQPLSFKKGNSKSLGKTGGYGSLTQKTTALSPQQRKDQQSGGSVNPKLNNSAMHAPPNNSQSFLKKAGVKVFITKSGLQEASTASGEIKVRPQTTRNMEQGDKKQLSPEVNNGKPPLKRKKSGVHSHSNSNAGQPHQRPVGLILQQQNYV